MSTFVNGIKARSLQERGDALARAGNFIEALPLFQEAVALSPQSASGWSALGWAHLNLRQYEEALAACDRACALDPHALWQRRTFAHLNRLHALHYLRRFAEALSATDALIQYATRDVGVWVLRGYACGELNRAREAEDAFVFALKLEPTNRFALTQLSIFYAYKMRDYAGALEVCERLVTAHPNAGDAWKLKADILVASRQYQDAYSAYERAVACGTLTGQSLVGLWSAIGWALILLGRYGDALAALDKGMSYSTEPVVSILCNRAVLFQHIERTAEARECEEAAYNVTPTPLVAQTNMAESLISRGRLDEAKSILDDVFAVTSRFGCAWYASGRLEAALGHYEDALAAFDTSIQLAPTHASHYQGLAELLLTLDDAKHAVQVIERAMAIDAYHAKDWRIKAQALRALGRADEANDAERHGAALLAEQVAQVDAYLRAKEQGAS